MKISRNTFIIIIKNIIFLKYICFLCNIIPILNECEKETPFLINGLCTLQYCSQDDFIKNKCPINNTIVKNQWLNNIIWIGDKNYRYVNLATFSTGSLVVETTSASNSKRMFFGIRKNGRSFFMNKGKSTRYYSMEVSEQSGNDGNGRLEGEIFIAKINEDGNEYLVSVGRSNGYTELYDFDNKKIYQISTTDFLGREMDNIRGVSFSYESNNIYYVVFCYSNKSKKTFYFNKFKFTSIDIKNNNPSNSDYFYNTDFVGKKISCYMTDLKYIYCFYTYNLGGYTFGYIKMINLDYNVIDGIDMNNVCGDETTFMKCIYFKDEIGIFIYYYFTYDENTYNKVPTQHLKILFKIYRCTSYLITYCYIDDYSSNFPETILDQRKFNMECLLNDLIKVSDTKVAFISTNDEKDMLYVVLLNVFTTEKILIRYYDIRIFSLYNFKIFMDLRAHLYNDFISLAFSFCPQETCDNKTDNYYSALMIFSYPNGTDTNLNITDYLFRNNDIKITNIVINLWENVYLENNIFGFEYSKIRITNITGCNFINFLSSINQGATINENYNLTFNENIKLQFINYNIITECIIKYKYIVSEPTYENDINYFSDKIGTDDEISYKSQIKEYEGKTIHYTIILTNNLVTSCEDDDCELCLDDKKNNCLTCKYNYTIFKNNDYVINKICSDEKKTDAIENESSEEIEKQASKVEETEINIEETIVTTQLESTIATTTQLGTTIATTTQLGTTIATTTQLETTIATTTQLETTIATTQLETTITTKELETTIATKELGTTIATTTELGTTIATTQLETTIATKELGTTIATTTQLGTTIAATQLGTTITNTQIDKTKDTIATTQLDTTKETISTTHLDKTKDTIATTQLDTTKETISTTQLESTKETISTTQLESTKETIPTTQLYTTNETIVNTQLDTTKENEKDNDSNNEKEKNIEEKTEEKVCSNEEIVKNECKDGYMTKEQMNDCYNDFKEEYLTQDHKGENIIVETKNSFFQIATLDDQKNNNNSNISSIDIGECESILKQKYNISKSESLCSI